MRGPCRRAGFVVAAALLLAACGTRLPDSAFEDAAEVRVTEEGAGSGDDGWLNAATLSGGTATAQFEPISCHLPFFD